MPVTELSGHQVHVDDEGFLTEYDEWDEDLAKVLAAQIGIDLTDAHWKVIRFLREDFLTQGETATARRVQTAGGVPVKELCRKHGLVMRLSMVGGPSLVACRSMTRSDSRHLRPRTRS